MEPPKGQDLSQGRRNIITSATKRLSVLDRPKSRNKQKSDRDLSSKVKISPPFNFRDLSNSSASSNDSDAASTRPTTAKYSNKAELSRCTSPLNKPLPSLPVATIISSSPVKVRRSLIDAQEKPLRRSVSPTQKVFEDWPALTPQKPVKLISTQSAPTNKIPSLIKPSISEGLVERIKMLNLNEGQGSQLYSVDTGTQTTSANNIATTFRLQSTKVTSSPKSPFPPVRHNRTSELRLQLASANSEEQKYKKPGVSSPLSTTSGNVTHRARQTKRPSETAQIRSARTHSRSRSRHRVTDEGSPYTLPAPETKNTEKHIRRPTPLSLDPSKIDTNFGIIKNDFRTSKGPQHDSCERQLDGEDLRKSSLPLPKRRVKALGNDNMDYETLTKPEKASSEPTSANEHNDEVERLSRFDTNSSSLEDAATAASEHSFSDANDDNNSVYTASATAINSIIGQSTDHTTKHELTDRNSASLQQDEPGVIRSSEEFHTKSLSKSGNRNGPILRISPLAEELLRGIGSVTDHQAESCIRSVRSSTSNLGNSDVLNNICPVENTTSADDKYDAKQSVNDTEHIVSNIEAKKSSTTENSPAVYGILRKPIAGKRESLNNIQHVSTTSAPPIKSGAPRDTSHTAAWPFKVSAVAPFRTATTPERKHNRNTFDVADSTRNSTYSSQAGSSPSYSVQSKYDITQALDILTPGRSGLQDYSVPKQDHEGSKSATSKLTTPSLPPRGSSRIDRSAHPTGLRIPSARAPSLIFKTAPPVSCSNTTPNTLAQPKHVKSFVRSTQTPIVPSPLNSHNLEKPLPSPMALAHTTSVSTGKAVLKNIRGLFHKRSNLHGSIHGSLRRSAQARTTSGATPTVTPSNKPASLPHHPKPSPVRVPSRNTPPRFPTNRIVRPLEPQAPAATTGTTKPPREAPELASATDLVHRLLDLVQQDNTFLQRKEQLLELSKLLVSTLSNARDAEHALERANVAAAECELKCIRVRRDVGRVDAAVRRIVDLG